MAFWTPWLRRKGNGGWTGSGEFWCCSEVVQQIWPETADASAIRFRRARGPGPGVASFVPIDAEDAGYYTCPRVDEGFYIPQAIRRRVFGEWDESLIGTTLYAEIQIKKEED